MITILMCFCTQLWKINCTYKRVVVLLGYEGYQLQWIFPTKLNPHVSDNAISTYYSTSHITNLPHMETLWLKIIKTLLFNSIKFLLLLLLFFLCSPDCFRGFLFSPSILCFQKFCDFFSFFQRKSSAIDINFFPNNFVKIFVTQKIRDCGNSFLFLFF
jgi:hypothetical protein